MPASHISKEVADLFVQATTFTAGFTEARTTESLDALTRLCKIPGPVVDNLLHCLAGMSDAEHTLAVMDATGPAIELISHTRQVSFESQRTAMKVSAPADQLGKSLSKLQRAIALCPDDLDLLVAKACILHISSQLEAADDVLDVVSSIDPTHFEALTWKKHPETWAHALRFPRWDKKSSTLHPVMAAHLTLGHRVQVKNRVLSGFAILPRA